MQELDRNRWKALAVVAAAFVMTVIDISIVNVALPSIGTALNFSESSLQWVITAYAITYGGFVLLGGRSADLLGRRRMFMAGVALFTAASFVCGFATSEGVLIGARAVQGLGAAVIAPAALSIVSSTFPEGGERNRALGVWGALGGSGAALGVLAGGVLTKYLGWEWIFYVNVPIGVLVLALAPRFVRESRAEQRAAMDIPGAVTVTGGLALLVYAISKAPDHGWSSTWTFTRIAGAAAILAGFLVIESRVKDPLMPFPIFRRRSMVAADISAMLVGAAIFANFFLLTLYVQQVLGWSALRAGLTFIAIAGTAMVWAGIAQTLVTRIGPKPVMAAGFTAMTLAMLWYTRIPVQGSYWPDLLPGYLLTGFALPFTFIPVSITALMGVEQRESGLASGLLSTSQQIGGSIGTAVVSSVLFTHLDTLMRQHGPQSFPQSFTSSVQLAFWVCAGIGAAGLVATLVLVRRRDLAAAKQPAADQQPLVA
jgi:EmrB/QacA subfamily drug resistance transporter